eukprot:7330799-Pyramimonas_sp.AAC.1
MPPPCRATERLVIEGGGLKEPRVPRDILLRGSMPRIELSKEGAKPQLFVRPPQNKPYTNNINKHDDEPDNTSLAGPYLIGPSGCAAHEQQLLIRAEGHAQPRSGPAHL